MEKGNKFEEIKREQDPETEELRNLIKPLINKYGSEPIYRYVETTVGKTLFADITNWLNGVQIPSPSARKSIISALKGFKPESLPPSALRPQTASPKAQKLKTPTYEEIMAGNDEQLKKMAATARERGKIKRSKLPRNTQTDK